MANKIINSSKKKIYIKIALLFKCFLASFMLAPTAWAEPLLVANADQMAEIAEMTNAGRLETFITGNANTAVHFKLTRDIALKSYSWVPIGTAANPFKSIFDCDGNAISVLFTDDENSDYAGLFGSVSGTVENCNVKDSVQGSENIGGIAILGSGTANDPFIVRNETDLRAVGRGKYNDTDWSLSAHYKLIANIALNGNWEPIGSNDDSNPFTGSFDGNGYAINGIKINNPALDNAGLFGHISGGTITNLGITGGSITGGTNIGAIAGNLTDSGTITKSYSTISVTGTTNVGGLVGNAINSAITHSASLAAVVRATLALTPVEGRIAGNTTNATLSNNVAFVRMENGPWLYATHDDKDGESINGTAAAEILGKEDAPIYLKDRNMTFANISDETKAYDGDELTPAVTWGTEKLIKNKDYKIAFTGKNGINTGTGTFTLTGIDNYTGVTEPRNYTIEENPELPFRTIKIAEAEFKKGENSTPHKIYYSIPSQYCGENKIEQVQVQLMDQDNYHHKNLPLIKGLDVLTTEVIHNGSIIEDTVIVISPIPYDKIIKQKWGLLMINNNPQTNGGYIFTEFEWFKNGEKHSNNLQYYRPADFNEMLNTKDIFNVQASTEDGIKINSCEGSPIEIAHPPEPIAAKKQVLGIGGKNPAASSKIYNIKGKRTANEKIPAGVYIVEEEKNNLNEVKP